MLTRKQSELLTYIQERLKESGVPAVVTSTLMRRQYWKKLLAISS